MCGHARHARIPEVGARDYNVSNCRRISQVFARSMNSKIKQGSKNFCRVSRCRVSRIGERTFSLKDKNEMVLAKFFIFQFSTF